MMTFERARILSHSVNVTVSFWKWHRGRMDLDVTLIRTHLWHIRDLNFIQNF